jgi:hypothetical protein
LKGLRVYLAEGDAPLVEVPPPPVVVVSPVDHWGMTNRSCVAVIKSRVVHHGMKRAPLSSHLTYLLRDGVAKDGDLARYSAPRAMTSVIGLSLCDARRTGIISGSSSRSTTPAQISDIKTSTRGLMADAERDFAWTERIESVNHTGHA